MQLRQGPEGLGPEGHAEPRTLQAQSGRLIEVERSVSVDLGGPGEEVAPVAWPLLTLLSSGQNATLVAEKVALQGQLQHLEGQLGSLQGRAQELLLQSQRAQEYSSRLQVGGSLGALSPALSHAPFPPLLALCSAQAPSWPPYLCSSPHPLPLLFALCRHCSSLQPPPLNPLSDSSALPLAFCPVSLTPFLA